MIDKIEAHLPLLSGAHSVFLQDVFSTSNLQDDYKTFSAASVPAPQLWNLRTPPFQALVLMTDSMSPAPHQGPGWQPRPSPTHRATPASRLFCLRNVSYFAHTLSLSIFIGTCHYFSILPRPCQGLCGTGKGQR